MALLTPSKLVSSKATFWHIEKSRFSVADTNTEKSEKSDDNYLLSDIPDELADEPPFDAEAVSEKDAEDYRKWAQRDPRWGQLPMGASGKTVGYAVAESAAFPDFELLKIAVHPDFRRKGFADMLIRDMTDYAVLSGFEKIFLEVRESGNPAIGLYRKNGFVTDGIRKNYYSQPTENAVLMSLDLLSR